MNQQLIEIGQCQEQLDQLENNFLQLTLNGYYGQTNLSSLLQKPKQVRRLDLKQYVFNIDKFNPSRYIELDYDLDDYYILSSPNGNYFCVNIKHEKTIYLFNVFAQELFLKHDYSENDNCLTQFTLDSKYAIFETSNALNIVALNQNKQIMIFFQKNEEIMIITNNKRFYQLCIEQEFTDTLIEINMINYQEDQMYFSAPKCLKPKDQSNKFFKNCLLQAMLQIHPYSIISLYFKIRGNKFSQISKSFGITKQNNKIKLYSIFKGKLIKNFKFDQELVHPQINNVKIFSIGNDLVIQYIYYPIPQGCLKVRQTIFEIHCFQFKNKVCDSLFIQLQAEQAHSKIRGGVVEFYSF